MPALLVYAEDERLGLSKRREWEDVQTVIGLSESQVIFETFLESNDGLTPGTCIILQWGNEVLTPLPYEEIVKHVRSHETQIWIKAQYRLSKDHPRAPMEWLNVSINTAWIQNFHPGEFIDDEAIPATNVITPHDETTINVSYKEVLRRLEVLHNINVSEHYDKLIGNLKSDD